jgi:hypothetical protein
LARASNAALPAVEPNWIESAARNEFALFEPSESTQVTRVPEALSESSSQPYFLRMRLGGL